MPIPALAKNAAVFVFQGTVLKTKSANLRAVTDKERTVVARVDAIIKSPEAIVDFATHEITIKLAKGERVRKDQTAVFYTVGWIFGENLAVQSLGHEPVKRTLAAAAAIENADPVAEVKYAEIRDCAAATSVIIRGKVIAVGDVEQPDLSMTDSDSRLTRPISEHEPMWTEAIVEVHKVHKGQAKKKRVVIRFPSSDDVQWSHAPKFKVGQEGIFMLHPDIVSQLPNVGAAAKALNSKETFTCLSPVGFQPLEHDAEVAVAEEAANT